MMMGRHRVWLTLTVVLTFGSICRAGPPFVTDDPEPVPFKHYELYFGGTYARFHEGESAVAPLVEFNFGALPDLQLHIVAPIGHNWTSGESSHHGLGDVELGAKYRFLHETDTLPQVAIFPLVELPTGDHDRGLGNGKTQVFLPIWLQKSFGKWTTYGGGGWWYNPGTDSRDYWRFGWELQRELGKHVVLGGEVYHETPTSRDNKGHTAFNLGGFYSPTEHHHVLFSFGRDIDGPNQFQMYLAFQVTN